MTGRFLAVLAAVICLCPPALAQTRDGAPTVNSYTPAQEMRARQAASRSGYGDIQTEFVQDGNFFLTASKGGSRYSLTVTPSGQVYASTPMT